MKTKIFSYSIFIFVLVLIQSTVLDYIRVFNVKPNLLIVFIVAVALLTNNVEGAFVGFFAGLSQDIASGKVLGLYALLGLYLGFVVGSLNKRLYRENFLVVIFFTFVTSIIYESAIFLINMITTGQNAFLYLLRNLILPEAIYNSIVSIIIFIFVLKMHERFESGEKFTRRY